MTRAVAAGMSWRRFQALLAGLSPKAVWRLMAANRPLEGEAVSNYFASMYGKG